MRNKDPFDFLAPQTVAGTHAAINRRVREAAEAGRLILIGSGELPKKCIAAIRSIGGFVPFVVEYEPRLWGGEVLGVEILSPDAAACRLPERALLIAGVWSPNHRYSETREWIGNYSSAEVFPVAALFWAIPAALGPHYQLAPPQIFAENRDTIRAVHDALADDASRSQFLSHLRWRVTLDPAFLPESDRRHMYFDPGLFRLGAAAAIADVGAFDGDTLRIFLYWQGTGFGSYHAFEPDPISFGRLEEYCRQLPSSVAARVHPLHMAAGAACGSIRFAASGKPGAQADRDGGVAVECCRLDQFFGARRLDFLKLDVEGAERDALAGAWPLVERDRPVMAIAVYHHPHDIFDLPSLIMQRTPGYRYALRSHDHDGIDLVFYAIPAELARSDAP